MAGLKPAPRPKRPPRRDSESTLILPAFRPFQLATLERKVPTGDAVEPAQRPGRKLSRVLGFARGHFNQGPRCADATSWQPCRMDSDA